jgi:F0F1-type ATP synthase assembly protein I
LIDWFPFRQATLPGTVMGWLIDYHLDKQPCQVMGWLIDFHLDKQPFQVP